ASPGEITVLSARCTMQRAGARCKVRSARWVRGAAFAGVVLACLEIAPLSAQRGQPTVELTTVVEHDPAGQGADLHAALTVKLPQGYHTNSNKPRDPSLIPITLTFGALPVGVTVAELVFPEAIDLKTQY